MSQQNISSIQKFTTTCYFSLLDPTYCVYKNTHTTNTINAIYGLIFGRVNRFIFIDNTDNKISVFDLPLLLYLNQIVVVIRQLKMGKSQEHARQVHISTRYKLLKTGFVFNRGLSENEFPIFFPQKLSGNSPRIPLLFFYPSLDVLQLFTRFPVFTHLLLDACHRVHDGGVVASSKAFGYVVVGEVKHLA